MDNEVNDLEDDGAGTKIYLRICTAIFNNWQSTGSHDAHFVCFIVRVFLACLYLFYFDSHIHDYLWSKDVGLL